MERGPRHVVQVSHRARRALTVRAAGQGAGYGEATAGSRRSLLLGAAALSLLPAAAPLAAAASEVGAEVTSIYDLSAVQYG